MEERNAKNTEIVLDNDNDDNALYGVANKPGMG
ncbi:hypothetical protein W822_12370 [Advenella kashmirensis W13003]|uniref:Uncharacterized protein n=1 Tax=Advenella kashmirensis W13003 TaxID=1424334 RepID=V8QSM8_9BURK|nr:hypothetical protein W822_12370 [Advenella kashmirensis W13003]